MWVVPEEAGGCASGSSFGFLMVIDSAVAGVAVFSAEVLLSPGIELSTTIFSGLTEVEAAPSAATGSVLAVAALWSAAVEAGAGAEAGSDFMCSLSAEVEDALVVAWVIVVEVVVVVAEEDDVATVAEEDWGVASELGMLIVPL